MPKYDLRFLWLWRECFLSEYIDLVFPPEYIALVFPPIDMYLLMGLTHPCCRNLGTSCCDHVSELGCLEESFDEGICDD